MPNNHFSTLNIKASVLIYVTCLTLVCVGADDSQGRKQYWYHMVSHYHSHLTPHPDDNPGILASAPGILLTIEWLLSANLPMTDALWDPC